MRSPRSFFGKRRLDTLRRGGVREPPRRVGIVGTFDVENYGDLLFPMIAQASLARRLESVEVVPFSPNHRSAPVWPYDVRSTLDLPDWIPSLAAVLIGGGQLIRFDSGYPVPADSRVRLPIDYWLTPAVLGALAGKPVFWNAIGVWTGSPPAPRYDELVAATLEASQFVGLRDEASRGHLALVAPAAELQILPDTAFSIARLWPLAEESPEFVAWRASHDIRGRYVVLQADRRFDRSRPAIGSLIASMGVETAVLLPVCRCHGDASDGLPPLPCGRTARSAWPSPRLLSEIIGRSAAVVASSLHACITAISYGVPVVRVPSFNAADRKFEMLEGFDGVACIERPDAVAAVLGRGVVRETRAIEYADRLDRYWDQVARALLDPQSLDSRRSISRLLRWAGHAISAVETACGSDGTAAEPVVNQAVSGAVAGFGDGIPLPSVAGNAYPFPACSRVAGRDRADRDHVLPNATDTMPSTSRPVAEVADPATAMRIRVHREAGAAGSFEIHAEDFDHFAFIDGDRLEVVPEEAASLLPVTWGDRHVEIAAGRAIRVPPVYRFCEFRGFRIPAHLVSLTGAGPDTLDLIGRAHIRNFERTIGLFPEMTLIDLGCGIGRDAFQILEYLRGDGRYVGVDVTRDSIEWCRRHITPKYRRFTFHHVDAYNELYNPFGRRQTTDFRLPVADSSVDRITLASVFTHLLEHEVVHYMREFRRVLKPDGLAYATFFLHSPEAIEAARTTGTTQWAATFEHPLGEGVYGNDPSYPRGAVSYTDATMRRMMQQSGLATDRPYIRGSWSGLHGDQAEDGQDAVILRRA